jgi:hypothetical protein
MDASMVRIRAEHVALLGAPSKLTTFMKICGRHWRTIKVDNVHENMRQA